MLKTLMSGLNLRGTEFLKSKKYRFQNRRRRKHDNLISMPDYRPDRNIRAGVNRADEQEKYVAVDYSVLGGTYVQKPC